MKDKNNKNLSWKKWSRDLIAWIVGKVWKTAAGGALGGLAGAGGAYYYLGLVGDSLLCVTGYGAAAGVVILLVIQGGDLVVKYLDVATNKKYLKADGINKRVTANENSISALFKDNQKLQKKCETHEKDIGDLKKSVARPKAELEARAGKDEMPSNSRGGAPNFGPANNSAGLFSAAQPEGQAANATAPQPAQSAPGMNV